MAALQSRLITVLRCPGVDFLCPRGWCYATRCRFEGDGHAILWHDGRGDKQKKLVITNSSFDALRPTPLGRYHHDSQFYLLNWLSRTALPYEVFAVMFLDTKHHLLALEEMFRGTLTGTSVWPREIARRALALDAAAVVLAHNHPSGDVQASRMDVDITRQVKEALALLEVHVLDHFIVAPGQALSMYEAGLMP